MTDPKSREVELKLEARPEDLGRLKAHGLLAEMGPPRRLVSTYFDTPDLKLRQAGLSLRIRADGARRVQTVKTASAGVGLYDRGEWESDIEGDVPDLKTLASSPLPAVLNGDASALGPRFSVAVERTTRLLSHGAAQIELTLDQGLVTAGSLDAPILEVELELKRGDASALFVVGRRLLDAAPLRLSTRSKGEAGFEMGQPAQASAPAQKPALDRDMTAAQAFQAIARVCLTHFLRNERLVRETGSVEAVHQARVGLRRLRAAVALFKDVLGDPESRRIVSALRRISVLLGAARDLDVLIERVGSVAVGRRFDEQSLLAALERSRTAAYDQACAVLASPETARLVFETAAWIEAGTWLRARARKAARTRPVAEFARDILKHRAKALRKACKGLAGLDAPARHRVRIRAKKVRYGAEFFAGLAKGREASKAAKAFVGALKPLQEALGELNDLVNAERILRVTAETAKDPAVAFAAGALVDELLGQEKRLLKTADRAAKRFREAEAFLG